MLSILVGLNNTIYGRNSNVSKSLLKVFDLNSEGMKKLLIWQSRVTPPVFPQSYQTLNDNEEYLVHNSVTQPVQFSLGRLPTMSSIAKKPGARFDRINTDDNFCMDMRAESPHFVSQNPLLSSGLNH
jgi:hypothetical protein